MRIGVVGGGVLGLTLAHRLGALGNAVTVLEAGPDIGGLAASHDYGPFTWDRFYHCILPQDVHLLSLLEELGLRPALRWTRTATGYWRDGRFHDMTTNLDLLRFPLLSPLDKARLGAAVVYATRFADPYALYGVGAAEWLTRICGRRTYEVFWRPLLRAKFGTFHDRVAAVFIWATLKRLFGARTGADVREKLGYVTGGYATILAKLRERIESRGGRVVVDAAVRSVEPVAGPGPAAAGCRVVAGSSTGGTAVFEFDQVFFTAPTRLARAVVAGSLLPTVERAARENPTSAAYLGVTCLVLALRRPLTPYYVLNIGDESVALTGVIEMTNLVDPRVETNGLSLVYLPLYHDSDDPIAETPEGELVARFRDRGLRRVFPALAAEDTVYAGIHRARFVQPLPLVREGGERERAPEPRLERPLQVLNTSLLRCATLNNNEVVGLVEAFCERNRESLESGTPASVPSR